jgi:hypothetical protein
VSGVSTEDPVGVKKKRERHRHHSSPHPIQKSCSTVVHWTSFLSDKTQGNRMKQMAGRMGLEVGVDYRFVVIPAQAGIQSLNRWPSNQGLDSRLRENGGPFDPLMTPAREPIQRFTTVFSR